MGTALMASTCLRTVCLPQDFLTLAHIMYSFIMEVLAEELYQGTNLFACYADLCLFLLSQQVDFFQISGSFVLWDVVQT